MRDRIFAPEDKRWLFNKLRITNDNPDGLFESNKDILVFAAALGFKHNNPVEFGSKKDVEIPFHVFNKDNKDFLDVIALGSTLKNKEGDVNILSWQDDTIVEQKFTLFEQYANGGLEIIDQEVFQNNTYMFDNLLQLIHNEIENNQTERDITNLEDLVELI